MKMTSISVALTLYDLRCVPAVCARLVLAETIGEDSEACRSQHDTPVANSGSRLVPGKARLVPYTFVGAAFISTHFNSMRVELRAS